jgi:hypothetical protein
MAARPRLRRFALATLAACSIWLAAPLHAQPDFGDNGSRWANDGECDDPRFEGAGSADTLLEEDRGHDANDCRKLFNAGRIALRSADKTVAATDIDFGDDSSEWARDGECDDPRFEGASVAATLVDADLYHDATDCRLLLDAGRISLRDDYANGTRIERGRLDKGDDELPSGEFADAHTFAGRPGQHAVIDLRSDDFDPYVFVRSPSGEQFDNDDFEGDSSRSLLSLDLTESGQYRVTVTSYAEGESGGYTLSIDVGAASAITARVDHSGKLEAGDGTLSSGEYVDEYEFEGSPGQHVSIDLRSTAFDTYLILRDPADEQTENDDADDGGVGHSSLEVDLTESGTHRVLVTSYETGETGAYVLTIDPSAAERRTAPSRRDITTLTVGSPVRGELDSADAKFQAGEYHDTYVFDGARGDTVHLELSSSAFDTYLGVVTPSGGEIANDDFEGDAGRSVIELTLPEAGRYRVHATSYAAAETGAYRLALTTSAVDIPVERRSTGRVYGVFAGISDYRPPTTDLLYTAEDATRIRDALVGGGGMHTEDAFTFVDSEATVGNITRAVRDIGRRMTPEDTLVLFYSGHGSQVESSAGPTPTDPDGRDETISLYDGDVRDDELRTLFDEIRLVLQRRLRQGHRVGPGPHGHILVGRGHHLERR